MSVVPIAPRTAKVFQLKKNSFLKVICPLGEQVSDLVCFNLDDLSEHLSNGKTFDYAETIRLTTGNTIFSQRSQPMLTIVEDSVGVHDFLLAPCCQYTMSHFYNITKKVPTCLDNLSGVLRPYGLQTNEIPTAFNIFMNVQVSQEHQLSVLPPVAKAGDFIIFRAEMDLLIAMTACSAKLSNNQSFKPIDYQILDGV